MIAPHTWSEPSKTGNPWLNTNEIEDIVLGAANQSGEDNRNVARMAVLLLAGLPKSNSAE
jgi:acetyl-CoA acetyltransferase